MAVLSRGQKLGKYLIQNLIKENLYTETYRVEDEDNNPYFLKLFILKQVPAKLINSETNSVLEIEYSRNIKHKHIVSFIEDGNVDTEMGMCQYYLTNYFTGELLSEKIRKEGSVAIDEAIEIYKSLLNGLFYLHEQGLYHNDITPRNVMLSAVTNGVPEIIDLGHVSPKCGGRVFFDVADLDFFYSANETFAGIYDEQSDIFAATAVFYAMLFGESPWKMELPEKASRARKTIILKEFRNENPIDFSKLNVENKVKAILMKGLGLSYDERYKRISEILRDLEADEVVVESKVNDKKQSQDKPISSFDKKKDEVVNKGDFEIKRGNGNGFKDIAGMNELKDYLYQRVIFVIKNKEKVEKYKLTPPNGLLLYGPPGCGKTFVAEKFAEETGFNFILVKASDLASIYVHGAQEKISQLFKLAEQQSPIVICFDEFDALVPDRSNQAAQYVSGEVNEFLSQLNNCSQRGIFVVGTTNRPDKIDPAVLRTGRMDKRVYVPLPDKEARKGMFDIHLNGRPFDRNLIDFDKLAELTEGYIASDIAYVVNDAAMIAAFTDKDITQELLEDVINNTSPSLNKNLLGIYDSIRDKMENEERANMVRPKVGFIHYN